MSHIANIYRKVNIIWNIEKWEKISILRPILLFLGSYYFNLQFSLFLWKVSGRKYTKSPSPTKFGKMKYKIKKQKKRGTGVDYANREESNVWSTK